MTDPLIEEWSARIRFNRQKLGLTQAQYGRLVGVTAKTIRDWEKGLSMPRAQHRRRLLELFQR